MSLHLFQIRQQKSLESTVIAPSYARYDAVLLSILMIRCDRATICWQRLRRNRR